MAITDADTPTTSTAPSPRSATLVVAAMASLGAGAIHAAAIGVHSEHRQAVFAFTILAAAQLGFGAAVLVRRTTGLAVLGAVVNAAAVGGWVMAKSSGIAFVDGLEVAESVQWADGAAAGLAFVATVVAARVALGGRDSVAVASPGDAAAGSGAIEGSGGPGSSRRWVFNGVGAIVAIATLTAMVGAGSHSHAGHGHGGDNSEAASDHDHGDPGTDHADHSDQGTDHAGHDTAAPASGDHADHGPAAAIAPKEYDPAMPIDLGGVDGVTPEQQAKAENLVAITLIRLPQWADFRTAEAAGYHSIGDGVTGHEHFVNWDMIDDGEILNPDKPESLVYDTTGGDRRLVSAMFMLPTGATLDSVPEVGGALTQWHIHDNLCFTSDKSAPRVAGITTSDGGCPAGLQKFTPVPMIHVWIEKNQCGPFAALEGVGAGQVKAGEEHLCDHEHGAGGS